MVFAELDWSPAVIAQCEGRINRIGGAKSLEYTFLVCKNSLDAMVFKKLERKTELTNTVVDQGRDYKDFCFDEQAPPPAKKRRKL